MEKVEYHNKSNLVYPPGMMNMTPTIHCNTCRPACVKYSNNRNNKEDRILGMATSPLLPHNLHNRNISSPVITTCIPSPTTIRYDDRNEEGYVYISASPFASCVLKLRLSLYILGLGVKTKI